MHELGAVIEIVKIIENFAKKNEITQIDTIILQIGELSSMIPRYIEVCYPIAVDGTLLKDTKLEIEMLPGNAACKECKKVFNLIQNKGRCPKCGSIDLEILCGKEFMIKEITAR